MSTGHPASVPPELQGKLDACREALARLERVAVAFSGGADSTLLLALAVEVLGTENVLAVMAVSPTQPRRERQAGQRLTEQIGAELVELETREMDDPNYTANRPDRCYHCKREIMGRVKDLASERGFGAVASGANADDAGEFRPGLRAGRELGVARPLLDAGMTKPDIRAASRAMGLGTWDKPSYACLATRIPYGQHITPERLSRIEQAEDVLHELGLTACRVRDHGGIARVEVPPEAIERAAAMRHRIVAPLEDLGYTYVTLDLKGLRSGSMDEAL